MTPEQVEALLRRVGPQLPVQPGLDAARAAQIRAHVAQLAGSETRQPPAAGLAVARWWLSAAAGLALAALWISAPQSLPVHELAFDLDLGSAPGELFHIERSGAAASRAESVFVGVRAAADTFVRILGRNSLDRIESLPLDRSGETTLPVRARKAIVFGGYRLENTDADQASRLTHIVVLCSAVRISDGRLHAAISSLQPEPRDSELDTLRNWAKRLGARVAASAQVRAIALDDD